MPRAYWAQIIAPIVFIAIFMTQVYIRNDIRKYISVGLFSIVYADLWCYLADILKIWSYPLRIFPELSVSSIPFNYIVLPIVVMIWMMYCPESRKGRVLWALAWSILFITAEFLVTRLTHQLIYTNGFDIHLSFLLWLMSWFIFYRFHVWVNKGEQ